MNKSLLGNKLAVLSTILAERMEKGFGGLSSSSAAVILTLGHHAPMTATKLAAIVGVTQSACTRLIDKLAVDGLIDKQPKKDGREVKFVLSAQGQGVQQQLQAARLSTACDLLDILNPVEQRHLDRILSLLLAASVTDRTQARHLCRFCDHGICDGEACVVGKAATRIEQQEQTV